MAVYEIFAHPELRRYKTHICSKATFLFVFIVALTFIPPLLIAYRSEGFWQKSDSYFEQPTVRFKHRVLVLLDTPSQTIVWSTYQNFNTLIQDQLRVPLIKSREEDTNGDGKFDLLRFQLEMPLLDTEDVVGVKLLLIFDYQLFKFSHLQMESMAFIQHSSPKPGAALEVVGDLRIKQKAPLAHKGTDTRYNSSVISTTSIYAEDFRLPTIFENYATRNVTTEAANIYPVWIAGRGTSKPFITKLTLFYPEERLIFTPGLWQMLKWGWVQYAAILLIFIFVLNRITIFIFQNQLVPTVTERPFKQKTH